MNIYCCSCEEDVEAKLVQGVDMFPVRDDLGEKYYWQCPECGCFTGTHEGSKKHKPLGSIATREIKQYRMNLHDLIDPLWKSKYMTRKQVYKLISDELGYTYHTGDVGSVEDAIRTREAVYRVAPSFDHNKWNEGAVWIS